MIGLYIALIVSFFLSVIIMPFFIKLLQKRNWVQYIQEDGSKIHLITKKDTPTMGGIVILLTVMIGYFVADIINDKVSLTNPATLIMFLMIFMGLVGFIDDILKIKRKRNLGLRAKSKLIGQLIVVLAFIIYAQLSGYAISHTEVNLFLFKLTIHNIFVAHILFLIFYYLLIGFITNAVNLTDGLDGLATGVSIIVFVAYVIIALWEFDHNCATVTHINNIYCYSIKDPLSIGILSASLIGGCLGFLWWNAAPASIFMGDTGALGLGGAISALSFFTNNIAINFIICGMFLVIAVSVILQIGYFKLTKGKRIFRMAPLQHHFELKGWAETTITIRFWIVAAIFTFTGVGLFYLLWVYHALWR